MKYIYSISMFLAFIQPRVYATEKSDLFHMFSGIPVQTALKIVKEDMFFTPKSPKKRTERYNTLSLTEKRIKMHQKHLQK